MRKLLLLSMFIAAAVFFSGINTLCRENTAPGCGWNPCPTGGSSPPSWQYWNGSSYLPHTPQTVPVFLTASVRSWHGSMDEHWDNAIGFWNDALNSTIFADLQQDGALTRGWVVRDGSPDEGIVNQVITQL